MSSNLTQLDISKISPSNGSSGNRLDSAINITFTRDLDRSSILQNIMVIEDLSGNINTIDDLNKKMLNLVNGKMSYTNPFKLIQGTIEYLDKTVIYKPNSLLLKDKHYCVIVRSNVTSIYGETLFRDYLFKFNTIGESVIADEKIHPPVIDYPKDFSIMNKLSNINLLSSNVEDGVIVQVATTNEFNNIVFEYKSYEFADKIVPNKKLDDNNYYIRAKTLKSDWSEIVSVYIQCYDTMPVSVEDDFMSFDSLLQELNDEELEITIKDVDKRLSSKTNKILVELNKIIDMRNIDDASISLIKDIVLDDMVYDEYYDIQSYSVFLDISKNKTYIMLEV